MFLKGDFLRLMSRQLHNSHAALSLVSIKVVKPQASLLWRKVAGVAWDFKLPLITFSATTSWTWPTLVASFFVVAAASTVLDVLGRFEPFPRHGITWGAWFLLWRLLGWRSRSFLFRLLFLLLSLQGIFTATLKPLLKTINFTTVWKLVCQSPYLVLFFVLLLGSLCFLLEAFLGVAVNLCPHLTSFLWHLCDTKAWVLLLWLDKFV